MLDKPDVKNTGNFLVKTAGGVVLWPYGFVDTASARRVVLERIEEALLL